MKPIKLKSISQTIPNLLNKVEFMNNKSPFLFSLHYYDRTTEIVGAMKLTCIFVSFCSLIVTGFNPIQAGLFWGSEKPGGGGYFFLERKVLLQ